MHLIHSAGLTVDPPPYKDVVSKVGGPPESWGSGPPDPPVVAPLRLGNRQNSPALWVGYGSLLVPVIAYWGYVKFCVKNVATLPPESHPNP